MKKTHYWQIVLLLIFALTLTTSVGAEEMRFEEESLTSSKNEDIEWFDEIPLDTLFEEKTDTTQESFIKPDEMPFIELSDDSDALVLLEGTTAQSGEDSAVTEEEAPEVSSAPEKIEAEDSMDTTALEAEQADPEASKKTNDSLLSRDLEMDLESRDESSGQCGDNVNWTLDENGKLTISGTGPMKDFLTTSELPWHGQRINELIIESGVTHIGNYAFCEHEPTGYEVMRFETVIIPSSVTSIGKEAFRACHYLSHIEIPESVTSIGEHAFYYDNFTTAGYIGSGSDIEFGWMESIPSFAFSGCMKLGRVNITEGIKTIGGCAFSECSSLWSLSLATTLTTIGDKAFSGCSTLPYVDILSGITSIGDLAFENCSSLTKVSIFDGLSSIGSDAFKGCSNLEEFYVSDGNSTYSSINGWLVEGTKLVCCPEKSIGEEMEIPEGITAIDGNSLLTGYKGIKKVTLPKSFLWYDFWKLGWGETAGPAGSGCDIEFKGTSDSIPSNSIGSLWDGKSLIIPEGVKSIEEEAIHCSVLEITLPSSLTNFRHGNDNALGRIRKLESIQVAEGNSYFSSANGALLNQDKSILLVCPPCVGDKYTVPSGVKTIADSAMATCNEMTEAVLPEGVTTIEDNAFAHCWNLQSIWFPSTLTSIGYMAFDGDFTSPEVYYNGTREEAQKISIGQWNSFSDWHYLNGEGDLDYNYLIMFDKNDESASGSMDSITGTVSEGKRLPANAFTCPGKSFAGWNTIPDGSGSSYSDQESIKNIVHEDYAMIILYAQWKMTNPHTDTQDYSFKITFNKNASGAKGKMSVLSGKTSGHNNLPRNEFTWKGHDFVKWNTKADGSGVPYDDQASISDIVDYNNAEITLYAQWKLKTYAVAYDYNGGSDGPETQYKTYGVTLTLSSKQPQKTGYVFKGWATSPTNAAKKKVTYAAGKTSKYKENKRLTLFAVWEEKTYKITYNANLGKKPPKAQTKKYFSTDSVVLDSGTKTTRKGYTISGWEDRVNNITYNLGAIYNKNEDVTLYAIWKPITYTVMFDGNGADNTMEPVRLEYDETLWLKGTFKRTGYGQLLKKAWKCKGKTYAYDAPVSKLTSKNGDTVIITALWEPFTYTVHFKPGSTMKSPVNGTMASQKFKYDEKAKALSQNKYKAEGYEFYYWIDEKTGTHYPFNYMVHNLLTNGEITLTAVWKPKNYMIKYVWNDGIKPEGTIFDFTIESYETPLPGTKIGDAISIPVPTKKGYKFAGWYTNKDFKQGTEIKMIPAGSAKNYTIYAKWESIEYNVRYRYEAGLTDVTGSMASEHHEHIKYGEKITLKKNKYVRDGYAFAGWEYITIEGKPDVKQPGNKLENLTTEDGSDVWMTAKWSPNTVTLKLNSNYPDGSDNITVPALLTIDDTLPGTVEGFDNGNKKILSWNTTADGSGTNFSVGDKVGSVTKKNGDTVTLYAQWASRVNPTVFYSNWDSGFNGQCYLNTYAMVVEAIADRNKINEVINGYSNVRDYMANKMNGGTYPTPGKDIAGMLEPFGCSVNYISAPEIDKPHTEETIKAALQQSESGIGVLHWVYYDQGKGTNVDHKVMAYLDDNGNLMLFDPGLEAGNGIAFSKDLNQDKDSGYVYWPNAYIDDMWIVNRN